MSCRSNCGNAFGCTSVHSNSFISGHITGHTHPVRRNNKLINRLLHENLLQPERLLVLHSVHQCNRRLSGPVVVRAGGCQGRWLSGSVVVRAGGCQGRWLSGPVVVQWSWLRYRALTEPGTLGLICQLSLSPILPHNIMLISS